MKASVRTAACIALIAFGSDIARADDQQVRGADQAVGLFMQSCVQFAGKVQEMRTWLNQQAIPRLNPQLTAIFLHSRPGIGYDASNKEAGRLALTSEDNGVCTAYAERSDNAELIRFLETTLRIANIVPKLLGEHDDARAASLHHRNYVLTIDGQLYTMVVSTDSVENKVQAFVTLARHNPNDPL